MMDPIGNKSVLMDASVRKGPSATAAKSAPVSDAPVAQSEPSAIVEVTISKGNGLSEQPFDYAKVISLKQSIKNGDYKIDFGKLADSMIGTDILDSGRIK
jgi:flagellar biosynthesis anti-sigma factor FlgM